MSRDDAGPVAAPLHPLKRRVDFLKKVAQLVSRRGAAQGREAGPAFDELMAKLMFRGWRDFGRAHGFNYFQNRQRSRSHTTPVYQLRAIAAGMASTP